MNMKTIYVIILHLSSILQGDALKIFHHYGKGVVSELTPSSRRFWKLKDRDIRVRIFLIFYFFRCTVTRQSNLIYPEDVIIPLTIN